MKKNFFFLVLLLSGFSSAAMAATCTSVQSGRWDRSSTWSCTGNSNTPRNGDTVIISAGTTVTLQNNSSAANLTIEAGGTLVDNGRDLTLSGSAVINGTYDGTGNNGNLVMTGNGQTLSGTGTIIDIGRIQIDANITIPAGSNLALTQQSEIRVGRSGVATLTIDGTIDGSGQTAGNRILRVDNNNASTVVINGTVNAPSSYLEIQRNGTVINNGTVTLQYLNGDGANSAVWTQGNNSSLTMSQPAQQWQGTLNASATGNTVTYNGTATPLTPSNNTYYNLDGDGVACPIAFTVLGTSPCGTTVTGSPGTCVNDASIGTAPWTGLNNVGASDNQYAQAQSSLFAATITNYLKCTGYNFNIPTNAVIDGIVLQVESHRSSWGGFADAYVNLVKGGAIQTATNKATNTGLPRPNDSVVTYGGPVDLWGGAWTPADINNANFGAAFAAQTGALSLTETASIDYMPISVHYRVPGAGAPNHFKIEAPSASGLSCNPLTLTIRACADAAPSCTPFTDGVSGTMSATPQQVNWPTGANFTIPTGSSTVTKVVEFTNAGSVLFDATSQGVVFPTACNFGGSPACIYTTTDSGFIVSAPNHVAETVSTLTVQYARCRNGTPSTSRSFTNTAAAVNLQCAYQDPVVGTLPVRVAGTALNAINNPGALCDAAGASVTLNFDNNGIATASLQYADVGQMSITASATTRRGSVRTGSGSFITKPADFALTVQTSGGVANPAATDATGGAFTPAGQNFTVLVDAVNAAGVRTPNYGQELMKESVMLTHALVAPAGGTAGTLSGSFGLFGLNCDGTPGTLGRACGSNFSWDEVGIISLTPSVLDANYLGAGDVTGTVVPNVGRFFPASFSASVIAGQFANTCTAGAAPFTYNGQPFGYTIQPVVTVTAMNGAASPAVTRNYTGAFNFLTAGEVTLSYPTQDGTQLDTTGANIGIARTLAGTPTLVDNGDGTMSYAPGADQFTYNRTNGQVTPFTANLTLQVSSIDDGAVAPGDNVTASGLPLAFNPAGNTIRYGRGFATDTYGTQGNAGDTLAIPVGAQLFGANGWVTHSDDSCTGVSYTKTDSGITTSATPATPVTLVGGVGNINLAITADPDGQPGGQTTLNLVWPSWLPGPATATATFGIFRGDDRFLYWREQ